MPKTYKQGTQKAKVKATQLNPEAHHHVHRYHCWYFLHFLLQGHPHSHSTKVEPH